MSLPFDLPPWMLWTAAGAVGCAVLGVVGGSRRGRRRPPAARPISFEPLASQTDATAATPGRAAKAPAIAPPAPLADAPIDVEKRAHFRRPGNPILVLVADEDQRRQPWTAWVVDRSRHGLRLAVERPLPVGAIYTVRPHHAPPTTPWSALEVRHCNEVNGHWEAGCRFLKPPPVTVLVLFG